MCSVAPFNRYASNVLCSTDFVWLADEVAKPDDRSASAKLTTGLQTLHKACKKARTLNRALYALIRRAIDLYKHKMASVPQGATKCVQPKKNTAYAA